MWFKIKTYLSFLLKSTNQYGVHSPFVYNLMTQCFYKKADPQKLAMLSNIRKTSYKNHQYISVTDYGKGSKVFKTNRRKISDIAKIAGISRKRAALLLRIVNYFNPLNILEIGTSIGLGTTALSINNPNAQIKTLEGCPKTANMAKELFLKYNLTNIKTVIGDFKNTVPMAAKNQIYDLIYFDGNHQKDPTLDYFEKCLPAIHNNSIFIFDDINWSADMQEAWEYIKQHPKVTVTINTYQWGFVFFRKEQKKQHFTVRV